MVSFISFDCKEQLFLWYLKGCIPFSKPWKDNAFWTFEEMMYGTNKITASISFEEII